MSRSDVPSGWVVASIDDIASSSGGSTPSKSDPSFWSGGNIPWVSPKDMKTFHIRASEDAVTEKALAKLTKVPENSVLMVVRSGILARTLPVAINTIPVTINQDMRAFVPKQGVDPRFLAWQLVADEREILDGCSKDGTTVASIEGPALSAYPLKIAPACEQVRLVEKLEELLSDLDAGVAELKAAQRKLAQYRQSLLKAAVDGSLTADWRAAHGAPEETGAELLQRILTERRARWEQKQLARFAEKGKAPPKGWQAKYPEPVSPILTDLPPLPEGWTWASIEQVASDEEYALAIGPFGSNLVVSDYRDEGVPLVFVRNIRARTYGGASTKFVSLEKADQLKAHHVSAGDVLVTKMGEPPGDADVYPKGQPTAVITADCIKIRPQCGALNPHYLAAVINSPVGVQQIKPMTKGVAQKKVSLGRFSSFAVPLPPVQEQDTLVALLEAAFSSAREKDDAIEHGLKLARAQRKNLLKAAFVGQLVPQDPNDEPASELLARIRAAREQSPAPRGRRRAGSHPAPTSHPPTPTRRGRKAKEGA